MTPPSPRRKRQDRNTAWHLRKLEGVDAVVVKCGVGKVNAAVCAQILIDVLHPFLTLFSALMRHHIPRNSGAPFRGLLLKLHIGHFLGIISLV